MKFKYEKKVDIECWERVIKANDTYGKWFDTVFPTQYEITPKMEMWAAKATVVFEKKWAKANKNITEGMKKIFGIEPPEIICYTNTSPYSMDAPDYISISMERDDPVRTILHEFNHFMFKRKFPDFPNIEIAKEIITVINDSVFDVNDIGWKVFYEKRKKVKEIWDKTEDINAVLQVLD